MGDEKSHRKSRKSVQTQKVVALRERLAIAEIDAAGRDLVMYSAILGRRPSVGPTEADVIEGEIVPQVPTLAEMLRRMREIRPQHLHWPTTQDRQKFTFWMRHFSSEARRRLAEVKERIAS